MTTTRTVWKFTYKVDDLVTLSIPDGAQILHHDLDPSPPRHGYLALWALVDPDAPLTEFSLAVRGTGHPATGLGRHLATVKDGPFVWHIFEPTPTEEDR